MLDKLDRKPPTARQAEVLDFVRGYILDHARPPTIREIGTRLGTTSTNGVVCHVKALVRRGLLRRVKSGPTRSPVYIPARPEVVVRLDGTRVVVGTTGPAAFTTTEWKRWLRARLRELRTAADAEGRP